MAGSRYRPVLALLVFAGWMLITGLFGRLWEWAPVPSLLKQSAGGLAAPNYVAAIVFLGVVVAAFRWRDVGLNPPRSPRSLLLLWFPGIYVVVFLGLLAVVGLPPMGTVVPILVGTALAGISEELACRGVLYQGLRSRLSIWPAILLSTALFGAGHLVNGFVLGNFALAGVQSIAAFMTGISFMAIRIRTGSLYPGMVLHGLWDFSLLMVASGLLEHADLSQASGGGVPTAALLLPLAGVLPNFLYGLFLLRHVSRDANLTRPLNAKDGLEHASGTAPGEGVLSAETNEAERKRWNNPSWVDHWPKRERFTTTVTPMLLAALDLQPGERVLDIGCGGGLTTIAAAKAVGANGAVTGADISVALVALASRRAAEAGVGNVSFSVKDVQQDRVAGAPFNAAMSQFGVMFFDEPRSAFANIRAQLAPGGRLAFVCWQSSANNPWHYAAALKGIVPPPPPPAPGKSPTGPFAFADPDYVLGILSGAGFVGAAIENRSLTIEAPLDAIVDDAQLVNNGVTPDMMDVARAAVDRHMAAFRLPSGLYRFPLAVQVVTARNTAA